MERTGTVLSEKQFATFQVDSLKFGVELHCVQELIRFQEMTRVPRSPDAVCGLLNLRGQIVIAIDARRALGLPERPAEQQPMNVVLRSEDGCTSLLVDSIGDVVAVKDTDRLGVPENILPGLRQKILGVYQLTDSLMLIPDLTQVLS